MNTVFRAATALILVWAGLPWAAPTRTLPTKVTLTVVAAPPPEYEFGEKMTFEVSARSSAADIIGATVFVRAPGFARTFVGEAHLTPGVEITATYALNLTLRPLPPFAPVEYWWEIRGSGGESLLTDPQTFVYEDNRFDWRTLTRGILTVHWHKGDTPFGQAALDVATTALTQANRDIQAPLPEHVNIYIYADAESARAALAPVGRIWADGYADPPLGLAVVAVADDESDAVNFGREIPHELTHILIYQATRDRFAQVPTWLNEGLAVMNQAEPDPGFPGALAAARQTGTFLSLNDLCGPLPADPAQAQLAYAESESVARYIRDTYGATGITALLAAYADGLGCAAGVQRGLGFPLDELERRWLAEAFHVGPVNPLSSTLDPIPWIILAALVLFAPVLFFLLIRRKPSRNPTGF
jgi:peptidase MA superfamily protein